MGSYVVVREIVPNAVGVDDCPLGVGHECVGGWDSGIEHGELDRLAGLLLVDLRVAVGIVDVVGYLDQQSCGNQPLGEVVLVPLGDRLGGDGDALGLFCGWFVPRVVVAVVELHLRQYLPSRA